MKTLVTAVVIAAASVHHDRGSPGRRPRLPVHCCAPVLRHRRAFRPNGDQPNPHLTATPKRYERERHEACFDSRRRVACRPRHRRLCVADADRLLVAIEFDCGRPARTAPRRHDLGAAPAATPAATPAVAQGAARGIGDVPWSQVGPGWMLAVWTPVTPHMPGDQPPPGDPTPRPRRTCCISSARPVTGTRSPSSRPPTAHRTSVDWSGDGSHALFDVRSTVRTTTRSPSICTPAREPPFRSTGTLDYTRPDGKALLVTGFNGDESRTLKRIDMAGTEQFVYPIKDLGGAGRFGGDYLANRPTGLSSCWPPRTSATRSRREPTKAWW